MTPTNSDSEKARTAEEIADEVWQYLHKKLFIELLESYAAERVREEVLRRRKMRLPS